MSDVSGVLLAILAMAALLGALIGGAVALLLGQRHVRRLEEQVAEARSSSDRDASTRLAISQQTLERERQASQELIAGLRARERDAVARHVLVPHLAGSTLPVALAGAEQAIRDGFEELEGATITPDTTFEVPMDGVRVTWQWDAERGAYLRFQNGNPHLAISGEQIAVNNVVEVYTDHPPSPVDARSPNPVTVGGGRAVVHRDGRRIEALWGRDTPYEAFGFAVAETGEPIFLDAGRTFLHLARA